MTELTNLNTIRRLLGAYGLKPQKALGQNFIINPSICPKMAEFSGAGSGVCALEIGPGIGALTKELAVRCEKVVAVELDSGLLPLLKETLAGFFNVKIIHGDILKLDLPALLEENFGGAPAIVCANLPYYITTPVIMALLEKNLPLHSITVMTQKETARRLCATMPSRESGAVTAAVRWRSEPKILFDVSAGSFYPAPGVGSSVIQLTLRKTPPFPVKDQALMFKMIRGAFSQRRKTVLNSLSGTLGADKNQLLDVFSRAKVNPAARPEALSLEDFGRMADNF